MTPLKVVGALLLLAGLSPAAAAAAADPKCSYCQCAYGDGGTWFLHHIGTPVTNSKGCLDWCQKHEPKAFTYAFDCEWDSKSGTCYSSCPGGCVQNKFSKCAAFTTQEACNYGRTSDRSCTCPLTGATDECFTCYECQCDYGMGKITLNASTTHVPIVATPAICAKRCQAHGGGTGSGYWSSCGGPNRCQCHPLGCDQGCRQINNTCNPGPNHESCSGSTECSCPLKGSAVHPDCPTRTHPPVVPSSLIEESDGKAEGKKKLGARA